MPKVRTVRSIAGFDDATTKVAVSPSLPMSADAEIAALVYIDGPSATVQHIFGNLAATAGWALRRISDSGANAVFTFVAAAGGTQHTVTLTVPLVSIVGRCVLLQAAISGQDQFIGIGSNQLISGALGADYTPGNGVTSIGYDVNADASPVAQGTRIAAVGYSSNAQGDSDGVRVVTPLAGDLAPDTITNWTIYSFTQGLAQLTGPTNEAVPTGTVVSSIGAVAGTATFTANGVGPNYQLSPYPG